MSHSNAHAALRDDLCRVAHSLFARGLVASTAGNISARLPEGEGVLITPTDACLGFIDPAALAWVDGHGQQRSGAPASKTLALHQRIYVSDPQAHCVIHTHSTQLVALTLQGVWQPDAVLPPITPYFVMKVGRVPLVPYARPGAPAVAEAIAKGITAAAARGAVLRAVLCERLGPIVWQRSPVAAMAVLEELEETARLWLQTRQRGDRRAQSGDSANHATTADAAWANPTGFLSAAQIDELRQHFGATW